MSDTEDKENQLCREDRAEEYDQAVRRALTENAYVKKVNSQLIAKLNTMAADPTNATDASDFKTSRRADDKIVTLAKLEALESKQRSMDEMVTALRESLDNACRERDDANAKVAALLLAAEEPVALVNNVWERTAAGNWEQKYTESSKKLVEVMYERDRLKIKCDEMQGMKGVETVFISKKKDDWETKSEELAKQLNQVTFERNCLREDISRKVEELLAEKEDAENLVAEKASMENVIADLTEKVDGHSVTKSSMQLMIDSLQYKVAAIKLAKDVEVGNLRQELESTTASLVETTSQKDYLSIEHSSLKQRILALEVEATEVRESHEREVRRLQAELATVQASLSDADSNSRKLSADLKLAIESLNAMREENHNMSDEMQSVSDFKRRLDSAETNYECLASERDDLKLENSTLQHQIQNLQSYLSEITGCHHRVENAENSIEIVSSNLMQQAENEYLSKERDELMSKNNALQQKNETLQKKLCEITAAEDSASEAFRRLIGGLHVQLAEKDEIAETLKVKLHDFREEACRERDQLKSKISLLETALLQSQQNEECLRSGMELTNEEQEQLKSRIAVLETKLLESGQEADRLRSAMALLETTLAKARAQSEQERADFEAHRNSSNLTRDAMMEDANLEKEELKSKIASLEAELLRSKQEEETLQSEITSMNKSHAEVQANTSGLKSQVKSLSLIIDTMKDTATREQDELKTKIQTLEEELRQSMLNKISDAKRDRDQAMSKVEGLSDELKSTALALTQVQEFISKDKLQAAETQQQLRSLEAEKILMEASILSIRVERDEIIQQLELSRQDADDFKRRWESSELTVNSMTTRCEMVESEIMASKQVVLELNDKLESSESLVKALEYQCDNLRNTIAELSAKSDEADALMKVLQMENQRNVLSCRQQEERSNSEIESLENMVKSLKAGYESFKVEAEAAAAAQMKSCEAKLESLCAQTGSSKRLSKDQTLDDMITLLRQDRSKLDEQSAATAMVLEAAQKKISALELAVASLRDEYDAFRSEAESAAAAQVRSFEAKLEPIQDQLSSTVKELEVTQDEKAVLEQQIGTLSSEVIKFKMQNKGLLKAMDQLTKYM